MELNNHETIEILESLKTSDARVNAALDKAIGLVKEKIQERYDMSNDDNIVTD